MIMYLGFIWNGVFHFTTVMVCIAFVGLVRCVLRLCAGNCLNQQLQPKSHLWLFFSVSHVCLHSACVLKLLVSFTSHHNWKKHHFSLFLELCIMMHRMMQKMIKISDRKERCRDAHVHMHFNLSLLAIEI